MPTTIDYGGLLQSIKKDRETLRPFRDKRERMIRQYCGSEYGSLDDELRITYLNLMHQAADTMVQNLVSARPRALVNTRYPEFRAFARHFQESLNRHIADIRLERELRMVVLDAFFCFGIMKVYLGESTEVIHLEGEDVYVDPGMPYAEYISFDNFGFDTLATSIKRVRYMWDEYTVSKEELLDDPLYAKHRNAISSAGAYQPTSGDTAAEITRNSDDCTYYDPLVKLRDVWLPGKQRVVTFLIDSDNTDDTSGTVIREVEWNGYKTGPYHCLSFSDVPDNIIGVSPGMTIKALADLLNSLYRKQANQARRSRDIPIYEGGSEEDAKRIEQAEDGRWTRVKSKEGIDIIKLGGVDAGNQQFSINSLDMFDRMAGNLRAAAGLGAQTGTLGQDQLIHDQISNRDAKMQERIVDFTVGVMRDLGWLLWHDQAMQIAYEYEIPGTGLRVSSQWTPEHREGKFILYNFDLEPYSMQYKSPSVRANALLSYVSNIAVPLYELFAQQGGSLNLQVLTEEYADLNDLPRLKEILPFANALPQPPPAPPPGHGGERAAKPPTTTRTHIRQNMSTPAQQSNNLQRALAGLAQTQQRQTTGGQ